MLLITRTCQSVVAQTSITRAVLSPRGSGINNVVPACVQISPPRRFACIRSFHRPGLSLAAIESSVTYACLKLAYSTPQPTHGSIAISLKDLDNMGPKVELQLSGPIPRFTRLTGWRGSGHLHARTMYLPPACIPTYIPATS